MHRKLESARRNRFQQPLNLKFRAAAYIENVCRIYRLLMGYCWSAAKLLLQSWETSVQKESLICSEWLLLTKMTDFLFSKHSKKFKCPLYLIFITVTLLGGGLRCARLRAASWTAYPCRKLKRLHPVTEEFYIVFAE